MEEGDLWCEVCFPGEVSPPAPSHQALSRSPSPLGRSWASNAATGRCTLAAHNLWYIPDGRPRRRCWAEHFTKLTGPSTSTEPPLQLRKPKARSETPRRARPRGRPVSTDCEQRPQRGPQQQPFVFFLEESFLDFLPFAAVTVSNAGPVVLVITSEPGIVCTIIVLLVEISAGFVCA